MFFILSGFVFGFFIPFIARRLGKILPATMGAILYNLCHKPCFPNPHNPLQRRILKRKWQLLFFNASLFSVITGVLFALASHYLPQNILPFAGGFIWMSLCAAETDRRHMILPDCLTLPLLLLGFLFATQTHLISPFQSVSGALFAYGITTIAVLVLSFKKHTIFGAGDSKMAVALGAWLGIQGVNYAVFSSFFLFILYAFGTEKRSGAYGPALVLAGLFSFFILYIK